MRREDFHMEWPLGWNKSEQLGKVRKQGWDDLDMCWGKKGEILDKECLKWSCQAGGKEKGSRGRCSDGLCDNKD